MADANLSFKELKEWAKQIAQENGFKIERLIFEGHYNSRQNPRNVIYSGLYAEKRAVLKVYNDPRITDEPLALKNFNDNNRSRLLRGPELYKYKIVTPKSGWLIEEMLPSGAAPFEAPLDDRQRQEFISVFLEYRKNWPKTPTRSLSFAEQLPAEQFHLFRIARWLSLATDK